MDTILHELVPRSEGDGHTRGQRAMVVTAVLTGIAALIVALRCYARFGLMKITGREDWAILGALVLSFTYCGLVGGRKLLIFIFIVIGNHGVGY